MPDRSLSTSVEAISDWVLISTPATQKMIDAFHSVYEAETGETVSADPNTQSFLIDVPDEASVIVDCGSKNIRLVTVAPDMGPADVQQFIDDHVAPRILSHDGAFVLHAGSVRVGDSCILIAGDTGQGKSTLTGSLDAAGWAMMGDDAVLFSQSDAGATAQSTYRRLCLLPDSLREIAGIDVGDDPELEFKHRVPQPAQTARQPALPVAAVFMLAGNGAETPQLTRMSAASACLALVANSFALDPSDKARALTRMQQATGIAGQVPVYALDYPRTYPTLPQVHELIADQLARLGVATPQRERPR